MDSDMKLTLLMKLRESLERVRVAVEKAEAIHEYKLPFQIEHDDLDQTRLEIGNAVWYIGDAQEHLRRLMLEE